MPRAQKLKVYRTPIGFHDAYVAATSRKAALKAWGSDADLFARGIAEQVEDPELMREPLARPGTVVRRLRATREEQLAALPERKPARRAARGPVEADASPVRRAEAPPGPRKAPRPKPRPKPKPRPDRGALDKAEEALAAAGARHAAEQAEIARRQAALDRERRQLERRQDKERATLERRAETARARYERAMRDWRR